MTACRSRHVITILAVIIHRHRDTPMLLFCCLQPPQSPSQSARESFDFLSLELFPDPLLYSIPYPGTMGSAAVMLPVLLVPQLVFPDVGHLLLKTIQDLCKRPISPSMDLTPLLPHLLPRCSKTRCASYPILSRRPIDYP